MSSEHMKRGETPSAHALRMGDTTARKHGRRPDGRRVILAGLTRLLNPVMGELAGRKHVRVFALLYHRGRRSGRAYTTPIGARPMPDGFVIPLTFGQGADWFRNVQAAGGCVIRWNGADYAMVEPEVVPLAMAWPALSRVERVLVPLIGIEHFVRLRHAPHDISLSQRLPDAS